MIPPVVMLAGGLGTRIQSISNGVPKALIPLAGRPFLFWKLRELEANGVEYLHILTGHGSHLIEDYIRDNPAKIKVQITIDNLANQGTGQALTSALKDFEGETFLLTYGDNLLDLRINELMKHSNGTNSLMAVTANLEIGDKRNVEIRNSKVVNYTKASQFKLTHMDYGYALLHRNHVLDTERNNLDDIFQSLAQHNLLDAHITEAKYFEIGTPSGFERANNYLITKE